MIIIFDGTDNTGKTTIAKALSERIGVPYFTYDRPKQDEINNRGLSIRYCAELRYAYDALGIAKADIIIDRAHPSEYVYGPMLRGMYRGHVADLDTQLSKYDSKIIICHKDNAPAKSDEKLTERQLYYAKQNFALFVESSECEVLYLDTSDEDLKYQLLLITNFIYSDSPMQMKLDAIRNVC